MTLGELKQIIDNEIKVRSLSTLIIMSQDSEGNGFSPLCEIVDGYYTALNTWSGEYSDESVDDEDVPALFLFPIN